MPLLKTNNVNETLIITLDDPNTRNAFSPAMAESFYQVLNDNNFNALIVLAEGPLFCSGGNLQFYKSLASKEEGLEHNQRITEILDHLYRLPVPTTCYVQGPCYGGGVELISCFDWVVSHPASLFGLWQRRIGLTFGWGGQERLLQRLSIQKLETWLFNAETLPVSSAIQLGLVDEIAFSSQGKKVCLSYVERAMALGSENFKKIKFQRQNQGQVFSQLWLQEDHKRALAKFK